MSEALSKAEGLARILSGDMQNKVSAAFDVDKETAAELRRLAPMEADLQQARAELAALKSALGASCDAERQQLWEASSGGGCSRALDAERDLAALRASLGEPIEQLETMPMREKEKLVMGWFAEDWAISKGLGMLHDYEKLRGMK
jgi:hypothetical protein